MFAKRLKRAATLNEFLSFLSLLFVVSHFLLPLINRKQRPGIMEILENRTRFSPPPIKYVLQFHLETLPTKYNLASIFSSVLHYCEYQRHYNDGKARARFAYLRKRGYPGNFKECNYGGAKTRQN